MLFNSYGFIFAYLPITLIGFFLLAKHSPRLSITWLVAASLFFYGWWNPAFVWLIAISIAVNYTFGYLICHGRRKSSRHVKKILISALAINLLFLAYFKYANYFIENISYITGVSYLHLDIVLPLGISFFTFTQIAFLVDVYRGVVKEYNFLHYALFVTYFPHLIAGPVLHHKQMIPQFSQATIYRINIQNINIGLTIFIIGLAKKVLLADQFSLYANPIFDISAKGSHPMFMEAWVGALAYTLQLYFDFSGYSDMAIGLSRMFNIKLPLNFNSPYKAESVIEFWKRWHMTLSAFLRDYLYVPLGGNRKGGSRRYVNLMVTMVLGGLWHGAGWTFVVWGGIHGIYLMINHGWRNLIGPHDAPSFRSAAFNILVTFIAVVIAWVPFRSHDFQTALNMWSGMLGFHGISLPQSIGSRLPEFLHHFFVADGLAPLTALNTIEIFIAIPMGLIMIWCFPNTQQWLARHQPAWDVVVPVKMYAWKFSVRYGIAAGVLLAISLMFLTRESAFLYFQF